MLEAKGEYRLFMDADNATKIEEFDKMLPYFDKGYNVVIASIAVKGAKIANTEKFYKRLFGQMGNLFIQLMIVPGIKDTQRGFKVFTAKAAKDIFKRLTLDRWGFDFEALAVARKLGYKVKEVPIRWENDPESLVKLGAYFKTLLEVVKVRINLWTGVYEI
jgi:dolichyl-phosphate beta-glucosyltransferase